MNDFLFFIGLIFMIVLPKDPFGAILIFVAIYVEIREHKQ